MSFSLSIFAASVPEDLKARWEQSLAERGLRVEFLPGFDPDHWQGGILPARLQVEPGTFPAAERYGEAPLIAGFEFYILGAGPSTRVAGGKGDAFHQRARGGQPSGARRPAPDRRSILVGLSLARSAKSDERTGVSARGEDLRGDALRSWSVTASSARPSRAGSSPSWSRRASENATP